MNNATNGRELAARLPVGIAGLDMVDHFETTIESV